MHRERVPAGPLTPGRDRAAADAPRRRPRHRADATRRVRLPRSAAWPLAAVALVALLGARALHRDARPAEGRLAGEGFLLAATRDDPTATLLSPDGLAAQHVAVYAALTRVFDRADTLVAAGRELVLVLTVLSALLLWRIVRRLGFGSLSAAVAVLLTGVPLLVSSLALLDVPAQLAVPWLLLAARLTAGGRPSPVVLGVALLAAAVAVLLAPDVLVLLLTAALAALATGLPSAVTPRLRVTGALLLVPAVVGAALLLPRWDPQPVELGVGMVAISAAAFLVVGGLAAWAGVGLRVPALALVGTTLGALLPSGRISALTVCLPLAAALAAGLGRTAVSASPARTRTVLRRAGAAALAGAVAAGVVAYVRTPATPVGTRTQTAALLGWAEDALPPGARLVADRPLLARLLHAGGDPDVVVPPGTARTDGPRAPLLPVVRGDPPDGALVLARFEGAGAMGPLLVLDPAPVAPTAEELARRRSLAGALLANPATTTGGRAGEILRSADIDARLLSVLAALGAQYGIGIRDLPPSAGEPADGPPARRALVGSLAGEPLRPGAPATERLQAWLHAQLPPFAPDTVTPTDEGVLIEFRYVPDPDALVSGSAP